MVYHSTIEFAELAIQISREAPVFSDADYEAILEMLEEAHGNLRGAFVGGQMPGVPQDWRIDGLVYREWDNKLVEAKARLLQRLRATKFFGGERRRDKARKETQKNIDGANWRNLGDYDQYMHAKQQGFDVRELRIGRKTTYQYATLKETPKGKTQC